MDNRFYEEISDMGQMKSMIEEYLEDYNSVNTITMPLVILCVELVSVELAVLHRLEFIEDIL